MKKYIILVVLWIPLLTSCDVLSDPSFASALGSPQVQQSLAGFSDLSSNSYSSNYTNGANYSYGSSESREPRSTASSSVAYDTSKTYTTNQSAPQSGQQAEKSTFTLLTASGTEVAFARDQAGNQWRASERWGGNSGVSREQAKSIAQNTANDLAKQANLALAKELKEKQDKAEEERIKQANRAKNSEGKCVNGGTSFGGCSGHPCKCKIIFK